MSTNPLSRSWWRNLSLLGLVFLHPLWMVVRPNAEWFGNLLEQQVAPSVTFVLPAVELAWFLEILLSAWLVGNMVPFASRSRHVQAPRGLKQTLDGFSFTFSRGAWVTPRLINAALGALASAAGFTVWITLSTQLDRDSYGTMFDHLSVSTYVGLSAIGTALIQGTLNLVLAVARTVGTSGATVALTGRVLTVGKQRLILTGRSVCRWDGQILVVEDEGGRLEIPGDPGGLRWLEAQLRAVEERGDASEVPKDLRRVVAQQQLER